MLLRGIWRLNPRSKELSQDLRAQLQQRIREHAQQIATMCIGFMKLRLRFFRDPVKRSIGEERMLFNFAMGRYSITHATESYVIACA